MIDPTQDPMKHVTTALKELAKLVDIEDWDSEEFERQGEIARKVVAEQCAELTIEHAMDPRPWPPTPSKGEPWLKSS